jgi:2-methylcitrate dehydratase PrpD
MSKPIDPARAAAAPGPEFFSAFAAFASQALQQPFPEVVRQRAVDAITDCIGCMAAGRAEPLAGKLLEALPNSGGGASGAAAMAFSDRRAQPYEAAMYNGAIAHALDYDDSSHPAYAHPSAVLVPTLLGASRMGDFSGADAVAGYVVGLEMLGKLARGLNNRHYENGWHTTSTLGTVAAAAAAATVLRLPRAQILVAINLATTFASGLRVHFGTMTKPLHAGMAARNGLLAVQLARVDFGCSQQALQHPYGFASVFNWGEGRFDLQAMGQPGEDLELGTDYGVSLKAFPSCGATHPGIEAATRLHGWLAGRRVRRVRIGVPALSFKPLIHHDPKTALQGKFSLEYCVAAGLLDGRVGIDTFTDERVNAPEVVRLIASTTMEVDERVRDDPEWATAVRVEAEDGQSREELVPLAIGKVGRWFSEEQMREKFMDCTQRCLPPARAAELFALLRGLPALPSVAALDAALSCD